MFFLGDFSLLITTYQGGKIILVRSDGEQLNTHFQNFSKPMGASFQTGKLAIGGHHALWEFHYAPITYDQLDQNQTCRGGFLPRSVHLTGDIDVHEIAWVEDTLWFINTRFSCLCRQDPRYSFFPVWRPPFITDYDPSDRCHLNGLAIRDQQPYYATALAQTNSPRGWRACKMEGGIIMTIVHNQILCSGLCMPHSPRWYQGKLWFLESGQGRLSVLEDNGAVRVVAELPGFPRGIDFFADFAFIGLSLPRESALFSDMPIVKQQTSLFCGVWIIHLPTGNHAGFLRFEGDEIREIFSVTLLPGKPFPDLWMEETAKVIHHTYHFPNNKIFN